MAMGIYGIGDIVLELRIGYFFCDRIVVEIQHSEQEQQYDGIHPIHAELNLGTLLKAVWFEIRHIGYVVLGRFIV